MLIFEAFCGFWIFFCRTKKCLIYYVVFIVTLRNELALTNASKIAVRQSAQSTAKL